MLSVLVVCTALALGQTAEVPAPAPPAPTPPPDRWFLMRELQGTDAGALLYDSRVQVSGWTEASFTGSTDGNSNLPLGFNYKANELLLQQNWLRVERGVLTSGTSEPTFGFHSDTILPGSDYRFTLARGIFDGQLTANNGRPNLYGIDPIQFYGEGYFPTIGQGMDVKVGRFFSQYGVEVTDAVNNAFCSHSYTDLYDPFTHTGILTTTKLTPVWTIQAGLVLGSDDFISPVDTPTFIGSVKWVRPDQRDSVTFSVIAGCGRYNVGRDFNNPELFDLIFIHTFNPRLRYSYENLFAFETNVPRVGTAEWFGVLNYLTYDLTGRLSATARLEFFDDLQGERTGFKGLYTALTTGVTFKPFKDVIFRPELRYDYNGQSRPFQDNHGLFTATFDTIVRW